MFRMAYTHGCTAEDSRLDGLGKGVEQILNLARLGADGVERRRIRGGGRRGWAAERSVVGAQVVAGCASDLRHGGGVRVACRMWVRRGRWESSEGGPEGESEKMTAGQERGATAMLQEEGRTAARRMQLYSNAAVVVEAVVMAAVVK